jgi:hypothetical protein
MSFIFIFERILLNFIKNFENFLKTKMNLFVICNILVNNKDIIQNNENFNIKNKNLKKLRIYCEKILTNSFEKNLKYGSIDVLSIYFKIFTPKLKKLFQIIENEKIEEDLRICYSNILLKSILLLEINELKEFIQIYSNIFQNFNLLSLQLIFSQILFNISFKLVKYFDLNLSLVFFKKSLYLCEHNNVFLKKFGVKIFGSLLLIDQNLLLNLQIQSIFINLKNFININFILKNSFDIDLKNLSINILKIINY